MDNFNHHDWKIHKILDENKRIYICPARGNGKPERTLRIYKELLEEGKEVVITRLADISKKGSRALLNLYKDPIDNIESSWLKYTIDRYIEEEMKKSLQEKNEGWTPKVRFDSWAIDESLYFDQMLWDRLVFDKHFCSE